MEFRHALEFIHRASVELVADRSNIVIGAAIGSHDEGPIVATKPNEFCLVAEVRTFRRSESVAREQALAACVEAGRRASVTVDPAEIRVIEIGDVFRASAYVGSDHGRPATLNTQKWFKAIRPGIGIANAKDYPNSLAAGTIGFFIEQNDQRYLVSCNHVIARAIHGEQGDPIVQPATLDLAGSDLSDHTLADIQRRFQIAQLAAYPPISPDDPSVTPPPTNMVDVAIAQLTGDPSRTEALSRLPYAGVILGEADPYRIDDSGAIVGSSYVYKVGRTTGFTEGYVSELAGTHQVHFDGWTATFVNQIGVRRTVDNTGSVFSESGDSGSALLTDGHRIAGLIFAGGPRRTLANPIRSVLAEIQRLLGPNPLRIIA
jgi:hypothetical protein